MNDRQKIKSEAASQCGRYRMTELDVIGSMTMQNVVDQISDLHTDKWMFSGSTVVNNKMYVFFQLRNMPCG